MEPVEQAENRVEAVRLRSHGTQITPRAGKSVMLVLYQRTVDFVRRLSILGLNERAVEAKLSARARWNLIDKFDNQLNSRTQQLLDAPHFRHHFPAVFLRRQ